MDKYTLNFAPLSIGDTAVIQIGRQSYDRDRLSALRREFRATHVFQRDENSIVDVPIATGSVPLGNITEELELAKDKRLWGPLMSASLLKVFAGARDIWSDRPLTILGSINRNLVQHPSLPSWIQKRTSLQFDTRFIYPSGQKPQVGLVCETRLRNIIAGTCADLMSLGASPLGRYVQIEEDPFDTRLMNRRRLIGRVIAINGDELVLEDSAEGFDCVSAKLAFLEARREVFDECIVQLLGQNAAGVLANAEKQAAQYNSGPGRKNQIQEAIKYLQEKVILEAVPGVSFKLSPLLSSDQRGFPVSEIISKPTLVFDPSATRKDDWNERGLKNNGPYDQRTFTPKKLNIAVVCQANYEGQVDQFMAKFLDGMPDVMTGQRPTARYGDGFLRRFRLDKPSVTFFTASGPTADAYLDASRRALSHAIDEGFKWDIVFVQIEESFKKNETASNPYYATKSLFLKRDTPVQSVRLETMAQPGSELVFSMNHLSLATYAKLGGTPWLLASGQTVAHELVIGLGSHSVVTSRIGARQRFVGITTVFSSDGSYLLSDRTAVVPYDEYPGALYETLKRSITRVRKEDNWRSSDKVRLVFHVFKPLKDAEAEAIKRAVDDLGLSDVTFAFLHIAPDHPYIIFDNDQTGLGYRDPKKGVLGPSRGLHLKLGDFQSLLVFTGASELKKASDGIPRPSLLKLHRLSTFSDMTYLARQAFEFSGHSWRMLSPEPFPITIRYSDLIAERLAGLSAVSGWDADAVQLGAIGRTLWFL